MTTPTGIKSSITDIVEIEVRDLDEPTLTPAQVADLFRVDVKTITRWAQAGQLTSFRTLGGHRRFRRSEVEALRRNSEASGREASRPRPSTSHPDASGASFLRSQDARPAGRAGVELELSAASTPRR